MDLQSTPHSKNFSVVGKTKTSELEFDGYISRVRVIVRVRPFLPHEVSKKDGGSVSCISALEPVAEYSGEVTVHLKDQESSRNECYKLDAYFGPEDNSVTKIFEQEVRPLIPHILQGSNATVFAYGATGSGKTYTMQGSDELPGLMQLAISTTLSMCQGTGNTVNISYYEIYMDKCYDLLEQKEKEIMVLDDKDGKIHLRGLAQHKVDSISEFNEVFSCIIQRRKIANTLLNDVSSRSHAVLVVTVSRPSQECAGNTVIGKLNLIDLAGNEDNRKTSNEGIRLQESAKINQSLFALSNVIYAINNGKPHVPYRESKLTRILQDSLGGTSRSLMVACLNPGEYMESVNTVSLAARSRHLSNFPSSAKNKDIPKVKVDMEAKLQAWLESKGKNRNGQRIGGFGSPLMSKTPTSTRSIKETNAGSRSARVNANSSQCSSFSGKRTMFEARRNLFSHGSCMDSARKVQDVAANKEVEVALDKVALEPKALTDEAIKGKSMPTNECLGIQCPGSEKVDMMRTPLRKVLSPINSITSIGNMLQGGGQIQLPDISCLKLKNAENELEAELEFGTPLDKFQTRSCGLKRSLVQEYLEFLNRASREELLELKGIGQKLSDYIIELREESPLKSLNDLEKLGLSSKQVHNMFTRAARGVFG